MFDQKITEKNFFIFCVLLFISFPLSVLLEITLFDIGQDFLVYCDASSAFISRNDPYYIKNLSHSSLPYVYPPITLTTFVIVCYPTHILPPDAVFIIYYILLLIFSFVVVRSSQKFYTGRTNAAYLGTLLATGFIGAYWNFSTGNIGIVGGFILAILYYSIENDYEWLGILSVSFISIFKIFPALFGVAHSVSHRNLSKSIKFIAYYIIIGVLSIVVSYILFPDLMKSYYFAVTGQLPQYSPVDDSGGVGSPTLLYLFIWVGKVIFNSETVGIILFSVLSFMIFILVIDVFRKRSLKKLEVLSFIIIGMLLILPRLKPYTLSYAVIPVYYLTKEWDLKNKIQILLLATITPTIGRIFQLLFRLVYESDIPAFFRLVDYIQPISLGLVFAVCYLSYSDWDYNSILTALSSWVRSLVKAL